MSGAGFARMIILVFKRLRDLKNKFIGENRRICKISWKDLSYSLGKNSPKMLSSK